MISESKLNKIVENTLRSVLKEILMTPAHFGAIPNSGDEENMDYDDDLSEPKEICHKYIIKINYLLIKPSGSSIKKAIKLAHEAKVRLKKYGENFSECFKELEELLFSQKLGQSKKCLERIWKECDCSSTLNESFSRGINDSSYSINNILGADLMKLARTLYKNHGVDFDFKFMGKNFSMRANITYNEGVSVIIKTSGKMIREKMDLGYDDGRIGSMEEIYNLFKKCFKKAIKRFYPNILVN